MYSLEWLWIAVREESTAYYRKLLPSICLEKLRKTTNDLSLWLRAENLEYETDVVLLTTHPQYSI
jgi:hypothetical protein